MSVKRLQLKPAEIARRRLHAAGFRCTPQRLDVFGEIVHMGGHFGAERLVERLRGRSRGRPISRATVYRTLSLLERCGLIRQVLFTESHSHYEVVSSRSHHEHMVCTECGRTIEFDDTELERAIRTIAGAAGFLPVSHKLEVYGVCDRCR